MVRHIAIIPARGGSKRIPRKNTVDFNGKPMIAATIEAALESRIFSKVLVSTDSEEIADISISFGAEVPFLREEFSDDLTPVSVATFDALIHAEEYWGVKFDTVTQLMANCPLRTSSDIIAFNSEFYKRDVNFLLSCFKFGFMNPWWAFRMGDSKEHSFMFPDALQKRSQDLESLYCPTGSIWMARTAPFKVAKSFYGENQQFAQIGWKSAIDIDDEEDLDFARAVSKNA